MEALALLCTLHADGPATLKRLRRAGCGSLSEFESRSPEELAGLLEVSPAVARRLLKESRHLLGRLGTDGFGDREEAAQGVLDTPAVAPSEGTLDSRDLAILGRVLERWSEEGEQPERSDVEAVVGGALYPALEEAKGALEVAVHAPAPGPGEASEGTRPPTLEPGQIDGLDARTVECLRATGIHSLQQLEAQDAVVLSRDARLPFASIRRLQFLARVATGSASSPRGEGAAPALPAPVSELPAPSGTEYTAPGEWVETKCEPLHFSPSEGERRASSLFSEPALGETQAVLAEAAEEPKPPADDPTPSVLASLVHGVQEVPQVSDPAPDSPQADRSGVPVVPIPEPAAEPLAFASPFHDPGAEPTPRKFWEPKGGAPEGASGAQPVPGVHRGGSKRVHPSAQGGGALSWNFDLLSPTPKRPGELKGPDPEPDAPSWGAPEPDEGPGGPFA